MAEPNKSEKTESSESKGHSHDFAKEVFRSVDQETDQQEIVSQNMNSEKPEVSCPGSQLINTCDVDGMDQIQSEEVDNSSPKPSEWILSKDQSDDSMRTIASSKNDANSKSEDCLLFDCAQLHGEDIIASSSQEELSAKNVVATPTSKFKAPFIQRKGADYSRSCGFAEETLPPNISSKSIVKSSGNIQHKQPLVKEGGDSENCPKSHPRKRKLAASPPMFDLSQSSVHEGSHSPDFGAKQVPLRSLKNFTKQVLTSKPVIKSRPRFTPLSLLSGPSGSLNFGLVGNNSRETLTYSTKLCRSPYSALTGAAVSPLKNLSKVNHRFELESNSDVEIDESD